MMHIGEWLIVLFTAVVAASTVVYVIETIRLRKAETDPCVIVFVLPSPYGGDHVDLVIQNVGRGVAYDIEFDLNRELPAFDSQSGERIRMDKGPFAHGIPALGPGLFRQMYWGPVSSVQTYLGERELIVSCRFTRRAGASREFRTDNPIDIGSFLGTRTGDNVVLLLAAQLSKVLERLSAAKPAVEDASEQQDDEASERTTGHD